MNSFLFYTLCSLGSLLSLYTLYLHYKISKEDSYHAVCDLSNRISCTATIKNEHSKMLGIPNGIYGIGFYLILALLYYSNALFYLEILATIGLFFSFYLAYQLYKIKTWCPVCLSIYLINLIFVVLIYS